MANAYSHGITISEKGGKILVTQEEDNWGSCRPATYSTIEISNVEDFIKALQFVDSERRNNFGW